MERIAFYPGTFDPITNGHVDILERAVMLADRVVMAIGVHPGKTPMFSGEERLEMLGQLAGRFNEGGRERVTIQAFQGLAVDAAVAAGASVLVRGLRDSSDFDYEMQMAGMNQTLGPSVATVFLPSSPSVRHITATLVRQIAAAGRDVAPFVPDFVLEKVEARTVR